MLKLMHLSIVCPTTPLPRPTKGNQGVLIEGGRPRVGHLTDNVKYSCHVIQAHARAKYSVMASKKVLVRFGRNTRPVTIETGDSSTTDVEKLKQSISECFQDVLKVDASNILLQIKSSDDWGGEFVDIDFYLSSATIPDKSIVRVLEVSDK